MSIYKRTCHTGWTDYYVESKPRIRTVKKPNPKAIRKEQDRTNIYALRKAFNM